MTLSAAALNWKPLAFVASDRVRVTAGLSRRCHSSPRNAGKPSPGVTCAFPSSRIPPHATQSSPDSRRVKPSSSRKNGLPSAGGCWRVDPVAIRCLSSRAAREESHGASTAVGEPVYAPDTDRKETHSATGGRLEWWKAFSALAGREVALGVVAGTMMGLLMVFGTPHPAVADSSTVLSPEQPAGRSGGRMGGGYGGSSSRSSTAISSFSATTTDETASSDRAQRMQAMKEREAREEVEKAERMRAQARKDEEEARAQRMQARKDEEEARAQRMQAAEDRMYAAPADDLARAEAERARAEAKAFRAQADAARARAEAARAGATVEEEEITPQEELIGLLVLGGIVIAVAVLGGDGDGAGSGGGSGEAGTVLRLQVAVMVGAEGGNEWLLSELQDIAQTADTSTKAGLEFILKEVAMVLARCPERWAYADLSSAAEAGEGAAERAFQRLEMDSRGKFQRETLTNVAGRQGGSRKRREGSSGVGGNEYVVVTIIASLQGRSYEIPKTVTSSEDLRALLQTVGAVRGSEIEAVDVIWTPQEISDFMSGEDVVADFPNLAPIN